MFPERYKHNPNGAKADVIVEIDGNSPPETLLFDSSEDAPPLPINGLLNPVDMDDQRVIEAFKFVVHQKIEELGGVPVELETQLVENPTYGSYEPRIIARYRTDSLTQDQLTNLEDVARRAYGEDVRTTKTKAGKTSATHLYPKLDATGRKKSTKDSTIGWSFGRGSGTPNRMYTGLMVYREIKKRDVASGLKAREDAEWFTQEVLYDNTGKAHKNNPYLVELRETGMYMSPQGKVRTGMYQTDLAETIIYTSLALANKPLPPKKPGLIFDIYHEMNQIGLGRATELPGLENNIEGVKKSMIIPLASPELADALRGNAKSVGLIGQVGTGKTQIIKHFLRQRLGVIMVPIDAGEFEKELATTPERRSILPRIKQVAEKTGKNVVLIVEDIENLANKDNPHSKLLLNELAGLYNSGYRVLWTTNHPEVFNHQLLEPERLGGKLIFCGLPNSEARHHILEQHLASVSRHRQIPLFNPEEIGSESSVDVQTTEEARQLILQAIAQSTEGFTPRYLKDIVVEAIDQYMYRISTEEGRVDSLTETELTARSFRVDDWRQALEEVLDVYDQHARIREDERLFKIAKPGSEAQGRMGFNKDEANNATLVNLFLSQFRSIKE